MSKRISLNKYFLLFFFFSFHSNEKLKAQETFKKFFYFGNYTDFIFPEKMNHSLIGGLGKFHNGPDNLSDHYKLIKLENNGSIDWVKRLNVQHLGLGSADPFLCEDGNYLISCDSKTTVPFEKNDPAIIKVDTNGNILWAKRYILDGPLWYGAELADSYIFCGFYTNFSLSDNDVQLLKIDKNGNMLWVKRYGGEANEEGSWILKRKNGNVIVGASSRSFGSLYDFFVFEINGNGDVIWSKVYGGDDEDRLYKILENENEDLICIGYTKSINQSGDIYIIKLNKSGDLIWSKAYDFGGYEDAYYNSSVLDTSGNIIFTGVTAGVISSFQDGWFMNINSENGNVNSSKVYDNVGTDDYSYCVMRDNEHVYTIGTFNETVGGEIIWNSYLIKSDFYGNFYCGEIDTMPIVTDVSTTVEDVILSVDSGGTEDTLIVTITDGTWTDSLLCSCYVQADFTYNIDSFSVSFNNISQGAVDCYWDFGDGNTSTNFNPINVYESAGTYMVTLVSVSEGGCADTMIFTLTIEETDLLIPNIITPNNDGLNDWFEIKNLPNGAIVNIYNRWGALLFESNNNNVFWDGRTKGGTLVPGGVYYYIVKIPGSESKKGFVEVIR